MSMFVLRIRGWFDRNFTFKGLAALILFLICAIPDWVSRATYWKGKVGGFIHFFLTPVGRIVLIVLGIVIIFLDHRNVLKKKEKRPGATDPTTANMSVMDLWLGFSGLGKDAILCVKNTGPEPVYDLIVKIPESGSCYESQSLRRVEPDSNPYPCSPGRLEDIRAVAASAVLRGLDVDGKSIPVRITYSTLKNPAKQRFDALELGLPFNLNSFRFRHGRPPHLGEEKAIAVGQIDRRSESWKELARRFKEIENEPIRMWAEWIYTFETKQYEWWIKHPSENAVKLCMELCKEAGRVLLAEQSFQRKFHDIAAVIDDGDRWLLAIYKITGIGKIRAQMKSASYGVEQNAEAGEIKDLPGASQVLCQMAVNGF
jgi:hypothetical protein